MAFQKLSAARFHGRVTAVHSGWARWSFRSQEPWPGKRRSVGAEGVSDPGGSWATFSAPRGAVAAAPQQFDLHFHPAPAPFAWREPDRWSIVKSAGAGHEAPDRSKTLGKGIETTA